ncbi:hypothetical protein [Rheinheimera mangrovi]|uniref:hypothetical protein n=1 Tax=Rheinheimera mangrovi TaxID=2498451 RepID=UPI000F8EDE53|nr:hypothetical protein [Rheinheimera mangrovi]
MELSVRYPVLSGLAGILLLLNGCGLSQPVLADGQSVVALPSQLKETSGLLCLEQDFISFNDSGNEPLLYRFDHNGQINHQLQLSFRNRDWEAISSDGEFLYLADTGNNAKYKQTLFIYKVPLNWSGLKQPYTPERLEITLPVDKKYQPYQHDIDFEALVYQQDSLWLISKSWDSQIPKRYKLDPKLKQQKLGKALPFANPGFLVTDAVFDQNKQEWWLVGYPDPRKAIWAYLSNAGFQPQIARYDENLLLLETKALATTGQVEGLCIDQDKQIWISEEGNKHSPALLIKTGFSSSK